MELKVSTKLILIAIACVLSGCSDRTLDSVPAALQLKNTTDYYGVPSVTNGFRVQTTNWVVSGLRVSRVIRLARYEVDSSQALLHEKALSKKGSLLEDYTPVNIDEWTMRAPWWDPHLHVCRAIKIQSFSNERAGTLLLFFASTSTNTTVFLSDVRNGE